MNCAEFQEQLFESVEGSLPAVKRVEAEKHLTHCAACRQLARQEQQTARFLSANLQQAAKALVLRPEVRGHILASYATQAPFWSRLAWPLGLAASLVVVLTLLWTQHFSHAPAPLAVEASYRVPIRISLKQGNQIIDKLSYQIIDISETLWADPPKSLPPAQKTPL